MGRNETESGCGVVSADRPPQLDRESCHPVYIGAFLSCLVFCFFLLSLVSLTLFFCFLSFAGMYLSVLHSQLESTETDLYPV